VLSIGNALLFFSLVPTRPHI